MVPWAAFGVFCRVLTEEVTRDRLAMIVVIICIREDFSRRSWAFDGPSSRAPRGYRRCLCFNLYIHRILICYAGSRGRFGPWRPARTSLAWTARRGLERISGSCLRAHSTREIFVQRSLVVQRGLCYPWRSGSKSSLCSLDLATGLFQESPIHCHRQQCNNPCFASVRDIIDNAQHASERLSADWHGSEWGVGMHEHRPSTKSAGHEGSRKEGIKRSALV
ncbi:hypothetical protein NMY22_g7070 [Coprinellus aureogranulatus]|nr:hypothetical protein NMY22_g7070 [Coprinellus aureogranulatus]